MPDLLQKLDAISREARQLFLQIPESYQAGLATGALVALAQLVVVHFLINRYAEKIQLKQENIRWAQARTQLAANLLYFSAASCPLSYYISRAEGRAQPRENNQSAFLDIVEKSRDLDAALAIYSNSVPVDAYANLSAIADEFRSAAHNARSAIRSWEKLREMMPASPDASCLLSAKDMEDPVSGRLQTLSQNVFQRNKMLYSYATHHACKSMIHVAKEMIRFGAYDFSQLDATRVMTRLQSSRTSGEEPLTAKQLFDMVSNSILEIENTVAAMTTHGFSVYPLGDQ